MMGKATNQKRRELFEDMKRTGSLKKPGISARTIMRSRRKAKLEPKCYCLEKYGESLPSTFVRCSDCPT